MEIMSEAPGWPLDSVLFGVEAGIHRTLSPPAPQVLERRNTVSGRAYKDDPTILGFNLLNELRCSSYEAREGG